MVALADIQHVTQKIVQAFDPERVILFGSYANGNPGDDSDVDLLVILPFTGKSLWKSVEIVNLVDPHFAVDLLVRDPRDIARRYSQGDPLVHDALDNGKVLYERGR